MRIGIFGGSFDPVHIGHLILAEHCREQANLDLVWFVPAAIQPHKSNGPTATDRQRLEMLALAVGGHESFKVMNIEIERGGVSYTVDTLEQLKASHPDDDFFLMMGGDSLTRFDTWREPAKICEIAIPLVVNRPGNKVDLGLFAKHVSPERMNVFESHAISCPLIDISSTEIRERIAGSKSFRYQTQRSVEKYIEAQNVYVPKG